MSIMQKCKSLRSFVITRPWSDNFCQRVGGLKKKGAACLPRERYWGSHSKCECRATDIWDQSPRSGAQDWIYWPSTRDTHPTEFGIVVLGWDGATMVNRDSSGRCQPSWLLGFSKNGEQMSLGWARTEVKGAVACGRVVRGGIERDSSLERAILWNDMNKWWIKLMDMVVVTRR